MGKKSRAKRERRNSKPSFQVVIDEIGDYLMKNAPRTKEEHEEREHSPQVNIGTVGHVDHGKTMLTAAIAMTMAKIHGEDK